VPLSAAKYHGLPPALLYDKGSPIAQTTPLTLHGFEDQMPVTPGDRIGPLNAVWHRLRKR